MNPTEPNAYPTDQDQPHPEVNPVFCLRCNEPMWKGAPTGCDQCGLQYDPARPETYRTEPMFVRWKFWFPAFCLAMFSGTLAYAVCLQNGNLGAALFFAVPLSSGIILGYGTHLRWMGLFVLAAVLIPSIVCPLIMMNFAGFFCGFTLGLIFLAPILVGTVMGLILRGLLSTWRWDQRRFFPIVVFLLLPYVAQAIESALPRRVEVAIVQTKLTVHSTASEAWNAVMFYEEVQHEPSWFLKLALPLPEKSEGSKQHVGDIVRCRYDRGYLVKKISRREEGRLLAFEVIEQHLHFERDVTLLDGKFEILPAGKNKTRIRLTTRYERHLSPRWLWEPIERRVIHSLHAHVLEGMKQHALNSRDSKDNPKIEFQPYHPKPSPPRKLSPATPDTLIAAREP